MVVVARMGQKEIGIEGTTWATYRQRPIELASKYLYLV
jgi:hypothetical protein